FFFSKPRLGVIGFLLCLLANFVIGFWSSVLTFFLFLGKMAWVSPSSFETTIPHPDPTPIPSFRPKPPEPVSNKDLYVTTEAAMPRHDPPQPQPTCPCPKCGKTISSSTNCLYCGQKFFYEQTSVRLRFSLIEAQKEIDRAIFREIAARKGIDHLLRRDG